MAEVLAAAVGFPSAHPALHPVVPEEAVPHVAAGTQVAVPGCAPVLPAAQEAGAAEALACGA